MGTVTLKVRTLLTGAAGALLLALALATAYLLGGAAQGTASPAQAASEPGTTATDRTIQVVGKGSATVVPDRLAFTVTVTATQTGNPDVFRTATLTQVVTNVTPIITSVPAEEALDGAEYVYDVVVADPGADTFTYTLVYDDGTTTPLSYELLVDPMAGTCHIE